jgi:hypothetical protein
MKSKKFYMQNDINIDTVIGVKSDIGDEWPLMECAETLSSVLVACLSLGR